MKKDVSGTYWHFGRLSDTLFEPIRCLKHTFLRLHHHEIAPTVSSTCHLAGQYSFQ